MDRIQISERLVFVVVMGDVVNALRRRHEPLKLKRVRNYFVVWSIATL
jgi:hypothetical protein